MNDRYQKNVEDGYQRIIKLYQRIGACKQKMEGDCLWNELTKNITQFRKCLSKLECHAYEELLARFEKSTAVKSDSGNGTNSSRSTESKPLFTEEDFPPIVSSSHQVNVFELHEGGDARVPEEWAIRFPLPVYFHRGEFVKVKVLTAVSPLEFYAIRLEDLSRLEDVERVLDACSDELRESPLPNDFCVPDCACAALIENEFKRAIIRMKGKKEVQVYLVDLGRMQFLSREKVFLIPKNVATMAPPLAHYCSLADIMDRQLDPVTVRRFVNMVIQEEEILIRAHGQRHRLYGELVDIYQEKKKMKQQLSPGIGWPTSVDSFRNFSFIKPGGDL